MPIFDLKIDSSGPCSKRPKAEDVNTKLAFPFVHVANSPDLFRSSGKGLWQVVPRGSSVCGVVEGRSKAVVMLGNT